VSKAEGPEKGDRQPVGKHWKSLDLSGGAALLKRVDSDWPQRLQLVEEARNEELWQYGSASAGAVYRLQLTKTATGWLGACSCPGTRKSEAVPGAVVPCKHLLALLMLDSDCPFPEGREWQKKVAEEVEELKLEAMGAAPRPAAGSLSDGSEPKEESPRPADPTPPIPSENEAKEPASHPIASEIEKVAGAIEVVLSPAEVVHRCSALPIVSVCPAADVEDGISVGSDGIMGAVGTAVHNIFEKIAKGENLLAPDDEKAATMSGCSGSAEEVRIIAGMAWKLWNLGVTDRETGDVRGAPIKSFFRNPRTEVELEHTMKAPTGERVRIKGRADVFEVIVGDDGKKRAFIVDLKTGWKDRNHGEQLAGYATGALGMDKTIDEAVLIVAWARLGFYDVLVLTRSEVQDWARGFLRYSAVWDGRTYTTGEHCLYCRRASSCEARATNLRALVDVFRTTAGARQPDILDADGNLRDPDELAELLGAARQIGTCVEGFVRALSDQIGMRGAQPLAGQPGKALGFSERSNKRVIDAGKGWETLRKFLSDPELAAIVSIGLTPALDAVAKKAEKGKGAGAKRELEAALGAAGALPNVGKSRTLTVVPINEVREGGE